MEKQDFYNILETYPTLTTHGFGVDQQWQKNITKQEIELNFQEERKNLYDCYEDFLLCYQWLYFNPKLSKSASTYHFKHLVEYWAKEKNLQPHYIHEGAFIAAAILWGFVPVVVKDLHTSVSLKKPRKKVVAE